jgi:hypothetical protein
MRNEFTDYLGQARTESGDYDLNAARRAYADALAADPDRIADLAWLAAGHDMRKWERQNSNVLNKEFAKDQILMFDADVMVHVGNGRAVRLGDMTTARIQIRMALRTDGHAAETAAYEREMEFWQRVLPFVADGRALGDVPRDGNDDDPAVSA